MLHTASDGTALARATPTLVPNERYMPPKYEDALAMPVGAFGPPPYSLVAGEEPSPQAVTNEQLVVPRETSFSESGHMERDPAVPPSPPVQEQH
ncbi:unnamed protein product [Echinostoma caproni]|uniref:Uncharacterized protein n=1 Tax=Echinostoma caproni TaxID=27848 RepID=A0A3P8L5I8_9TREM|nr:unnamed protein product [Echinostoma caproni]